jgi:hypothetical protein
MCFVETKPPRPVSVQLGMNMKLKPTRLNLQFKQVQRLPDWPILKLSGQERSQAATSNPKIIVRLSAPGTSPGTQAFAG